jgi:hypothetical protein
MGYMGCARTRSANLIFWLCTVGGACAGQLLPANQAAEVYERATNQFGAAIFFKPAQATNAGLACQLAPLIIQEVAQGQAPADPLCDQPGTSTIYRDVPGGAGTFSPKRPAAGPGRLGEASLPTTRGCATISCDVPASLFVLRPSSVASAPGLSNAVPALDPSRPAVYWAADTVQLNGKSHARFSYQWWYSPRQPSGQPTALPRQGIRITLDSRGQPAAWEILADTSSLRLIFVSQSLEKAAAAAFGKPLPGRRYSIERGLGQTPEVIVPRVIDDGPVAMGPIVYLSEGTRNVSTLICRCMPAQVKQLIATRTFDLTPLDAADWRAFLAAAGTTVPSAPALWPGDVRVANRLDECLRLPEGS